jgi:hypothetical protein
MQIAQPAPPAGSQQCAIIVASQVSHFLPGFLVEDQRAYRYAEFDVGTTRPETVRAPTGPTVFGLMPPGVAIVDQRIDVAIGPRPNTSAASPVTAIGTALGNELLAAKRSAAVAAFSGPDFDPRFVDELHEITNEKALPRTAGLLSETGHRRERLGGRLDAHDAAIESSANLEFHQPVGSGVQSVIAAHADIVTRVKLRSALSDDDRSGGNVLAAENLDAQSLGLRIPPVAR